MDPRISFDDIAQLLDEEDKYGQDWNILAYTLSEFRDIQDALVSGGFAEGHVECGSGWVSFV